MGVAWRAMGPVLRDARVQRHRSSGQSTAPDIENPGRNARHNDHGSHSSNKF